ncbi:MAG: aldo/keto reductase [Pseudonocardiaceae bacterium]|nr:aldo/keto reductase [Pseudonocardiaceae bacterium]
MGMSQSYGPADTDESLATLRRALELGVTFWDTADVYGNGGNERLLARVLAEHRDEVVLATKFGNISGDEARSRTSYRARADAGKTWFVDGTPSYVRRACDASLARLGVDTIDLYYQHRVDPDVPIEETVGAMAELVAAGKVREIGLSEAAAATIRRANAVHPVAALQSEYSVWERGLESSILPTVRELGITLVPFSPLGRGMLTGTIRSVDELGEDDMRRRLPRWQGGNLAANLDSVAVVERIAAAHGASAAQVALAWLLAQHGPTVPIPGTKRARWLEANAATSDLVLTADELAELAELRATGQRYHDAMMRAVEL